MHVELVRQVCYAAIFFMMYWLVQSRSQLWRFGAAVSILGFVVSIVGLVFHRLAPGKVYGILEYEQSMPMTPYLNKNHFANLLVMTFPVTAALIFLSIERSSFLRDPSWRAKILWFSSREASKIYLPAAVLVVQLTAILTSASRSGLVGSAAAASTFILLWGARSGKWVRTMALMGTVTVIMVLGSFQSKPLAAKLRLLRDAPASDLAVQFRLSNWRDAVRMFGDFPVFGVGAGGFHELFPLYKSIPERGSYTQVHFYHVENEFLEGLVETGTAGTLLITAVAVVLAGAFLKYWRQKEDTSKTAEWLALGAASGAVGMLAHSTTDFALHVPANAALFACFAGVLARLCWGVLFSASAGQSVQPSASLPGRLGRFFIGLFLVAGVWMAAAPFLWRQWRSDHFYQLAQDAVDQMAQKNVISRPLVTSAYGYLLKAKPYAAGQARYHFAVGRANAYFGLLSGAQPAQQNNRFRQSESALKKAILMEPLNAAYQYTLGWLYEEWGKPAEAAAYLRNAARLEPKNPIYHFKFGANQARLGNQMEAHTAFKEAVHINFNYLEPVLTALVDAHWPLDPDKLQELLPEENSVKGLRQQMAIFFERRHEVKLAEAIRGPVL